MARKPTKAPDGPSGKTEKTEKTRGHLGHRKRLRERFLKGGAEALADYELLELLLFTAMPRRDTKPVAKALLERFGSVGEAVAAEPPALREVAGVGDAAVTALKSAEAVALRLLSDRVQGRNVLSSWAKLEDYLMAAMARKKREHFRVLFLNRKNELIADEEQQRGTVDHTPVYTREVVARALELGATALVIGHNHPSGDPTPSRGDIDMTGELQEAGQKLGIVLHDHVIVSRRGLSSFKSLGLL